MINEEMAYEKRVSDEFGDKVYAAAVELFEKLPFIVCLTAINAASNEIAAAFNEVKLRADPELAKSLLSGPPRKGRKKSS
jgi:hypothetical protein